MCLCHTHNASDSRNLVKLKMSLEICPYCGKPFKRLKSHLPHCKMSPGSKPKEIQTMSFKQSSNEDKTNKVNTMLNYQTFQGNSKSPVKSKSKKVEKMSVQKEFLQNTSFTLTSTASEVPSTEGMNTDTLKPKTKWLAKREQEMLKRAKLQKRTRIEFTLVSQKEKHKSEIYQNQIKDMLLLEKEIDHGQEKLIGTNLTSELTTSRINCTASDPSQRVPWTTDCQAKQSMPKCKAYTNASEHASLTKEHALGSSVKEQAVSVFQTKTCVWDHIKHGLYKRRHDCVPVLFSIVSTHNVPFTKCVSTSESVLKPHTGNDRNATMKNSPVQFPIFQTSVQRPVEDVLCSRLQNIPVMAYSPEMATGYGGTHFFSSHSEMSTNENFLMKCQTSKPSSQSQGLLTELRLGDVRLKELSSWLGARTPKSPREAVTMFNKGWQWYYRKYIDVQKGGIGGIAMLIGSYCVLSYIWSYPYIKKHRWRKYH